MTRRRFIAVFALTIALMAVAVCVYLNQLSSTVTANLMLTVDEISRHDVKTIEGSLDDSYGRLESVAERMEIFSIDDMASAQERLNLEAASSGLFNALYLLDSEGTLYSSSYVQLGPGAHAYDEMFADGRDHFVMLYDDANGKLETTKESLIFGVRLDDLAIGERTFVAILGRSELGAISNQLLIESFDGQGVSSVVNAHGYYIVHGSPATDLAGRDNFYDMLQGGRIEGGVTIDDVRANIEQGKSFVINCVTGDGERLVLSFAPVEGTTWSFIMAVPSRVFEQRFAPFIGMTSFMLCAVVLLLAVMMALVYRFMKRSVSARAESAARAEFLSNMSHEIRTPLNGIIGLQHLMERHADDPAAMEGYVRKLGATARYLLSLVNDILDVSKIQAGKVDLAREPLDLELLIENVCELQREPLADKGVSFHRQTSGLTQPYLVGDEVRISQILVNILSNAVKFTPAGGSITLSASQRPLGDGARVLTSISIADTGCGMTAEFQRQIFDVFTQERNRNAQSQKGTGLGMSISHMLATQMGGSLSVESELGKGSCFTVELPLPVDPASREAGFDHAEHEADVDWLAEGAPDGGPAGDGADALPAPDGPEPADAAAPGGPEPADDAASDDPAAPAPDGAEEPLRLLVAEDNELNAEIIASILEEEGFAVTVAADGSQALEAFRASPEGWFSAILMDAQMPVMDGYEASREIRRLRRADARDVRIFACTASTFAEDRRRALESGMDDFLAKPLDVGAMLSKLDEIRRNGR